MIVREDFDTRSDGVKLVRTYSDAGLKIRQIETGIEYDEAIDVDSAPWTYEETDIPVEHEEESESFENDQNPEDNVSVEE